MYSAAWVMAAGRQHPEGGPTPSLEMGLDEAARAAGGRLRNVSEDCRHQTLSGVSIDTRTLMAGDLFFALRGPRFDGAAFAAGALRGGASGVVVHECDCAPLLPAAEGGAAILAVDDTLGALQRLARHVRARCAARG